MTTGALRQHYSVVDTIWAIETNSPEILACAASSFPLGLAEARDADFTMKISVDDRLTGAFSGTPVFRGRDHLVFAQYGQAGFFVLDLRRRIGFALVSAELAREKDYWRESIFPVVLGLMCLVLDAVPLHSACIEYEGGGLLVAGCSGMGKSTLAATFASMGFPYVSDDWLYLSGRTGRVHACPVNMKLMPEAVAQFFPELHALPQSVAMNGETSVAFDPAVQFQVARSFACRPETVVLLERVPGTGIRLRHASAADLVAFFSEPLDCVPRCFESHRARQVELIRSLSASRCLVLQCGGTPTQIAATVLDICRGKLQVAPAEAAVIPQAAPLDLLRRYASAPRRSVYLAGDAVVGIHSDSSHPFFGMQQVPADAPVDVELDLLIGPGTAEAEHPPIFFADGSLIGCSFGGNGCLLLDTDTRYGMAFADERLLATSAFAEGLSRVLCISRVSAAGAPLPSKARELAMGAAL